MDPSSQDSFIEKLLSKIKNKKREERSADGKAVMKNQKAGQK